MQSKSNYIHIYFSFICIFHVNTDLQTFYMSVYIHTHTCTYTCIYLYIGTMHGTCSFKHSHTLSKGCIRNGQSESETFKHMNTLVFCLTSLNTYSGYDFTKDSAKLKKRLPCSVKQKSRPLNETRERRRVTRRAAHRRRRRKKRSLKSYDFFKPL